jgi:hypothetical protein
MQRQDPTSRRRSAQRYLEIGDRLLHSGKIKTAAAAYVRCADAWLAETFLTKARELVTSDPVKALKALAEAERLGGPTGEGRLITAQAYTNLGKPEIAQRFLTAI